MEDLALHPKSTDLHHVSFGSDGPDSPRLIRRLRFTLDNLAVESYFG
jgi:hypothetical protein